MSAVGGLPTTDLEVKIHWESEGFLFEILSREGIMEGEEPVSLYLASEYVKNDETAQRRADKWLRDYRAGGKLKKRRMLGWSDKPSDFTMPTRKARKRVTK